MNNKRRKEIKNIINQLNILKDEINNIADDEQDYYDNMPENLQGSERGMVSEDALSNLSDASDSIDEVIECLELID